MPDGSTDHWVCGGRGWQQWMGCYLQHIQFTYRDFLLDRQCELVGMFDAFFGGRLHIKNF